MHQKEGGGGGGGGGRGGTNERRRKETRDNVGVTQKQNMRSRRKEGRENSSKADLMREGVRGWQGGRDIGKLGSTTGWC